MILEKKSTAGKINLKSVFPVLGLILVTLFFILGTRGELVAKSNLEVITNQAFSIMLAGVGATFVYAHGGIDLSIGAMQGLCILLVTVLLKKDFSVLTVLIIAILIGILCGFLVGFIHSLLKIPPFIVSICMQYILRGIVTTATAREQFRIPPFFAKYDSWANKIVILLLVVAAGYYLFEYSRIGKYIKAIGGNEIVAKLSGINVSKYKIIAYSIGGLCVGITGFLAAARQGGVNPTSGQSFEMDVLIAVVLGGLPLSGGAASKITCAITGALTIAVLSNGFILMGVNANMIEGIKGVIFIITVFLTINRKKGEVVK